MNTKLSSKELAWPLLIIGLALLIYGYSLPNNFVWDDAFSIPNNPKVGSWLGLKEIWSVSTDIHYLPVTSTGLWLQQKLWGFSPWGFHTISLTLQILNALLLYGLLRKMAPRVAGITALLFTVHPIQVETVAWIAEQKNLLSLFFPLLALHAFLDFERTANKKDYGKMFLFFALAFLSKSTAVCFAAAPLLYAWWKRGSLSKKDWGTVFPLFLFAGAIVLITIHRESLYNNAEKNFPLNFTEKFLFAGKAFFFYIRQTLLPSSFMTLYPKWNVHATGISAWLYPAGALGLYTVLFRLRHRLGRGAFALLCFYGLSIFPALGFIAVFTFTFSLVVDHFSYLSVPALLVLFCSAILFLWDKMGDFLTSRGWSSPSSFLRKSMVVGIIAYLSLLSFRLTLNYRNEYALWSEALKQNPDSAFGYNTLGLIIRDPKIAIPLFKKALELDPDSVDAYMRLGNAYEKEGAFQEAVYAYQMALAKKEKTEAPFPLFDKVQFYHRIGFNLLSQNKLQEALAYLEKAMLLLADPNYEKEKRVFLREVSVRTSPYEATLYEDLGTAYFLQGENEKAIEAFWHSAALNPNKASTFEGLGAAYMNLGENPKALQSFQEASRLDPKNEDSRKNLEMVQTLLEKKNGKN